MAITTPLSNWCITVMVLKWLHWFVKFECLILRCPSPCPFDMLWGQSSMLPSTSMCILLFVSICSLFLRALTNKCVFVFSLHVSLTLTFLREAFFFIFAFGFVSTHCPIRSRGMVAITWFLLSRPSSVWWRRSGPVVVWGSGIENPGAWVFVVKFEDLWASKSGNILKSVGVQFMSFTDTL